jgi:hypothetical protein
MRKWIVGVLALGLVVPVGFVGAGSAGAAPAAGTWEFSGSISAPARSTVDVDVSVSGTVEVSQEILDQVVATTSCSSPGVPEVLPRLYRASDSTYHALTNGGLVLTPIDDTAPTSIAGAVTVAPGSYELVLGFRCSTGGGAWQGGVSATPAKTISIASATSTSYLTLACLTSAIAGVCTETATQYTKVPSGTSVTFGAAIRRVWSDGVTTYDRPSGSQSLDRAYTYSSFFSSIASSCDHVESITSDYQYRCTADGVNFTPVTVETVSARSTYRLGIPVLSPAFAVEGSTVTVSGTVDEEYSDGSYWPADTSTRVSIQFQPTDSTTWSTIVYSATRSVAGAYSATFTMEESGSVRAAVSSTYSAAVTLTELTPTTDYQIGAPSFASELPPKLPASGTATVKLKWSDNTYRDAPDGTAATLEFASSFDPAASASSLTWREVATGSVSSGIYAFSPIPQSSGFWRVSVEGVAGTSKYVRVTGSTPAGLTATITPAAGEKPFVGAVASYDISASLTGYVGTETIGLWVDLGGGFQRVANFDSSGQISGPFSIRAGPLSGDITPAVEARDPGGIALASTTTEPVYIDGVESYEVTVSPPTKPIREGQTAKVVALASGTSFTGVKYALPWSGTVLVQRKTSKGWATLSTKDNAKGDRLTLTVTAIAGAEYRVFWSETETASKSFKLNVQTPTGEVRLVSARISSSRIEKGRSVTVSVRLQSKYSDNKFYASPDGTKVTLQNYTGSSWTTVKVLYVKNGRAKLTVKPASSRSYRFVSAGGVASKTLSVSVTAPQPTKLVVDWPSRYYADEGARFSVVIKTSSGSVWGGTTSLQLQYRFATYESWRLLDTKTYRGGRTSWGWGSGTYDTLYVRVVAPALGLSDQNSYS